jgi:HEAT repeat protein
MTAGEGDPAGWIATLKKGDLPARHEAEEALVRLGGDAVDPLLRALREDADTDFRWYIARVLARIGSPAIGHLIRALKGEGDQQVRRYLAASLGEMGEAAVRPLLALLADPEARVIGACHAGWRGAVSGVIDATFSEMLRQGARAERIAAAVGPAIGPASYEVGPEFPAPFLAEDPGNVDLFRPAVEEEPAASAPTAAPEAR